VRSADAIEHLATQIKVPAVEIGAYDFAGRQIRNHRCEIRAHNGFRICSVSDAEALAGWLATHIAQDERRVEHVRVLLRVKLYGPGPDSREHYPLLQPATARFAGS
jgi:Domain of unknown function (DUF4158)